jgi:hypothetical protein
MHYENIHQVCSIPIKCGGITENNRISVKQKEMMPQETSGVSFGQYSGISKVE